MESRDIIEVTQSLGKSIGLDIGSVALTELELSFATRLLGEFTDNQVIRMRQHILLYWNQSYLKSTLIDEFAKTIPKEISVENISSMSPETLFGSISEDRKDIIRPVFMGIRCAKIDELLGFLGTGNVMKDIVNTLNTVMEGKRVTRYLLKLGQSGFDKNKMAQLNNEGMMYDPHRGQLSYRPDVVLWAASRPIENRTYTYLRRSGHLYRYHVLQHEIDDKEAERFFGEDIKPDLKLRDELTSLNGSLAKTSVKDLRMPGESVLGQVFSSLKEIVKNEIAGEKQRLAEIIDIRTKGDIVRELTAHAFLRMAVENDFKDIEKLEYTNEDMEFIFRDLNHFVEFKINPLFADEYTERRHRKKRPRDRVKELVLEFLSDRN